MTEENKIVSTQWKSFDAGWYLDISNENYHRSNGTSSSSLKTLLEQSPSHLKYNRSHPEPSTPTKELGSAVHTLVLEPERENEDIAVFPSGLNLRTKLGRETRDDFLFHNRNKTVITLEQYDEALKMAERVREHPIAGLLVEDIIVESSIYWWYEALDLEDQTKYKELLKVRPDGLSMNYPVLIDLKSTLDGSYSGFIRSIQQYYYHVSAAMYLEGVNQCTELKNQSKNLWYTNFIFICVENFAPYEVSVYELSKDYLALGFELYNKAVLALNKGRENDWPGYYDGVRIIEPPHYAKNFHTV